MQKIVKVKNLEFAKSQFDKNKNDKFSLNDLSSKLQRFYGKHSCNYSNLIT